MDLSLGGGFKGLLPFLPPLVWRKGFKQPLTTNSGQRHFFGLCGVVSGLLAIVFLI